MGRSSFPKGRKWGKKMGRSSFSSFSSILTRGRWTLLFIFLWLFICQRQAHNGLQIDKCVGGALLGGDEAAAGFKGVALGLQERQDIDLACLIGLVGKFQGLGGLGLKLVAVEGHARGAR